MSIPNRNGRHGLHRLLLRAAAALLLLGVGAVSASCAPEPQTVSCSNDAICQKSARFHYCLESRCVECVGDASCGAGKACIDGRCAQ